ncbi:MAG: crotonase/enoyl-CoA hydratase family protein [Candidatus Accumulibacter sp.]|uniref:crotonase/enoyl-CoA hydratase family protein n=1 Tax=Accumulibacter sp. TaxID=2053492 RepID=UPI0019F9A54D|nr:crotonase/enoyl-CoA hydratase family protein [Accumulibacter sp.]MBE2259486.1 crotonase/enoyl-CoA hydratase family protein [Paracoccaceae bacterium]MCB1942390.1 crotonase/enoyl-CoA hydratase family protein [Accumulibacter sp.]MCP5249741.1 crotonase/enoyl-CoA hydratase family protein [Accumulibacter sp.]
MNRIRETHVTTTVPQLTTITIELNENIAEIRLNRPERSNAINEAMWHELRSAFAWADATPEVRVAMLSGAGLNFCSGIDLAMLAGVGRAVAHADPARSHEALRRVILDLQDCLTSVERCRKPVLAAIQGACIGGAIDLVSCCDMRYATADAHFAVREIDVGMTADVGTLQRLPRLVADGVAREMAYTGRAVDGFEAKLIGLVNQLFESPEALLEGVRQIARTIAAKSPLAIRGSKEMLNYGRDHSVADGLDHVATWNAAMLMSADLEEAMTAMREKRAPRFGD